MDKDRFEGALLGLAAGDALGTALEFKAPGTFKPIDDMTGGGPFGLPPGYWTDDTSMALCLAASLVEKGKFDPQDQMERYLRWYRHGYFSSTGECFDIGNATRQALHCFEEGGGPYSGSTNPRSAGNGSIMRLAPVPLFFARDPRLAVRMSADSSRTTHGAPTAVDACRFLGGLIVGAARGAGREELLSARYSPVPDLWDEEPLCPEIDAVAAGSYRQKEPPGIRGSGYVVSTLEAALWAFARTGTFRDGLLTVVNLGDDADSTGAVLGQLAGAFYGRKGIPAGWLSRLHMKEDIEKLAGELMEKGANS